MILDIYHLPVIYVLVIGDRKVQLELNLKVFRRCETGRGGEMRVSSIK
jgi:hypothetical protein